ncbi:MAG TPA: hypothetical protein VGZ93_13275 [Candidatus Methylacidiphilales bacterium]|jgi:hypothetical protein|nr:hypothetical protein [Candidatus Methylacidiphilales bacterium]
MPGIPHLTFRTVVLFCLVWASIMPGSGKVFTYSDLDCSCQVPDTWIFQDKTGDLIFAVDRDRTKDFLLRVVRVNTGITLSNKTFINSYEQGLFTRGFTITAREMVPLHGVTFYKVDMTRDMGNKSAYACAYLTLANGYGYLMECSTYQPNPEDDDELKAVIDSFDFINPPKIHTNSWESIFTPRDGLQHDEAYMVGYRIGMILALLAMLACPFLTLGAIGLAVYLIVRKKPGPPPSQYPPPPGNFPHS